MPPGPRPTLNLVFASVFFACFLGALTRGADGRPPARTLFEDEFSGSALDRGKWNVIVTGRTVNNEQQAYIDSTDVLEIRSGTLTIHPHFRAGFKTPEGNAFDFVSGRIDTRGRFDFTYGTAAAKMKLAAGAGLWPAFWALGNGRWPDTGEIDVMENVGDPTWVSAAMHGPGYSGDTPIVRRDTFPAGQDITGWHVYAVDWTPDSLVFRVDDRAIYRVTRPMITKYGRWAFDNPKFLILNLALGGGYPSGVNHVKTPYPGLPESTVRRIRADSAAVLVDWVRVTQR